MISVDLHQISWQIVVLLSVGCLIIPLVLWQLNAPPPPIISFTHHMSLYVLIGSKFRISGAAGVKREHTTEL